MRSCVYKEPYNECEKELDQEPSIRSCIRSLSTKPAQIMDMPRKATRESNQTQPKGEVSAFAKWAWSWWFLRVFCCLVFPEFCWVVQIYPFKQQKTTRNKKPENQGPHEEAPQTKKPGEKEKKRKTKKKKKKKETRV